MIRRVFLFLWVCACLMPVPSFAQDECPMPPRLTVGGAGIVSFTDGQPLNIRSDSSRSAEKVGELPEGTAFRVLEKSDCNEGIQWWVIETGTLFGWIAEGIDGVYLVEPVTFDWTLFAGGRTSFDPTQITLPDAYAGDLPALPITQTDILYLADANLTYEQASKLLQNGFVVVPGNQQRFRPVYSYEGGWKSIEGEMKERPLFITTDIMLNTFHQIFEQLLTELEKDALYLNIYRSVESSLRVAAEQYQQAIGTPLEAAARDALVYTTVAQLLMPENPLDQSRGYNEPQFLTVGFSGEPLDNVPADVLEEAQTIVDQIMAAEGQINLSFFENYIEDFGTYRVRGHYTQSEQLSSYFRVMSWLGRITFRANNLEETKSALLLMRAFSLNPASLTALTTVDDTITLLVGAPDDLTMFDYLPLAQAVFGDELSIESLSDTARLDQFQQQIKTLPKPRINSMVAGAETESGDLGELGQGFRVMGQRFTYDGYILGQLFAPYVRERFMPTVLDVPAALGSDTALDLINDSGLSNYAEYPDQMNKLRQEMAAVSESEWMESTASSWLWMLEPLWKRDNPEAFPPLMLTDAWRRRELQTGLASYTELKHGTMLYAKEPTGLGGGGPPLLAYGYVEPNPLLFARLSVLAATTYQRLDERGLIDRNNPNSQQLLSVTHSLRELALQSAVFAEVARRELAGEVIDDDMYYDIQEFATYLYTLEYNLYTTRMTNNEPLDPAALVTTIATNGTTQQVLHQGTGLIDYIYVVIPGPEGLQVARGGVYSYYEFAVEQGLRLTDEEWREQVNAGQTPPRPEWISSFYQP